MTKKNIVISMFVLSKNLYKTCEIVKKQLEK